MSEMSLQAVQFVPRFLSVIGLISITWLVAKFAKSMVLRTTGQCENDLFVGRFSKAVATFIFWAIILLMAPFVLGAAGVNSVLLARSQIYIGQIFSNWPIWMLLCVGFVLITYLVRGVSKFNLQAKRASGTSPKELQS